MLPLHSTLASPKRLGQTTGQTGIGSAVGCTTATGARGVARVHAVGAIPGCRGRCRLATCHGGTLGRWCWRGRLGLGRGYGTSAVGDGAGGSPRCSWGWGRRRGFGCGRDLLFEVGFGGPTLSRGRHVHAEPPSYTICQFRVLGFRFGMVYNVPFPSLETICTISPARMVNSLARSLLKSYKTLAVGFLGAAAAAGGATGGGGGGALTELVDSLRECAATAAVTAATG